jgi:hypothetical protein
LLPADRRCLIDPALADLLVHGPVVIQYRSENLRIVPVFGPNALNVSREFGQAMSSKTNVLWISRPIVSSMPCQWTSQSVNNQKFAAECPSGSVTL